jgi:hypothetical protein
VQLQISKAESAPSPQAQLSLIYGSAHQAGRVSACKATKHLDNCDLFRWDASVGHKQEAEHAHSAVALVGPPTADFMSLKEGWAPTSPADFQQWYGLCRHYAKFCQQLPLSTHPKKSGQQSISWTILLMRLAADMLC